MESEARRKGYGLLAELLRSGLTADTREVVAALPELADGAYDDLDEAAAAHERVFGREIFPYQGAFLDPTGRCGGAESARLLDDFAVAGLAPIQDAEHVSVLLEAVADAPRPRPLLEGHLLCWLPPFAVAVTRLGEPLSRRVVEQLLPIVAEHAAELTVSPSALPEVVGLQQLLEQPSTDLRRIAECLLQPVASGWWLTLADMGALARALGVPTGFGRRAQRLETMLRGAADHGAVGSLVDGLGAVAQDWLRRYEELPLDASAWAARLGQTRAALERLRQV